MCSSKGVPRSSPTPLHAYQQYCCTGQLVQTASVSESVSKPVQPSVIVQSTTQAAVRTHQASVIPFEALVCVATEKRRVSTSVVSAMLLVIYHVSRASRLARACSYADILVLCACRTSTSIFRAFDFGLRPHLLLHSSSPDSFLYYYYYTTSTV